MLQKITLAYVAEKAGVSKSAASQALLGGGGKTTKVSPKTAARIQQIAQKLNYRPNGIARSLSSGKTYSIGIMLPSPEAAFYATLSMSLQRKLTEKNYIPFFVYWETMDDLTKIKAAYATLISRGVDGIITCELEGLKLSKNIPTVIYSVKHNDFDGIVFNDYEAFSNLPAFLHSQGRKNIAFIGSQPRAEAYLNGLKKEGLKTRKEFIYYARREEEGKAGIQKILSLKCKPDAVICGNDEIAIAAMSETLKAGYKIPDEIAFIGSDNIKAASFCYPALTTLQRSPEKAADTMIEMLFARLNNLNLPITHKTIELELIIRESTGKR